MATLERLVKGMLVGNAQPHHERLIAIDTDYPSAYTQLYDSGDCLVYVTANPISAHVYAKKIGNGEMANYTYPTMSPWKSISIKNVAVHDGVTKIGNFAFAGNTTIESVTLCESCRAIGVSAFRACIASSLTIPNGVRWISDHAFSDKNSIRSVSISGSVVAIENDAFRASTWLSSLASGTLVGDGVLIKYTGQTGHVIIPQDTKFLSIPSALANATSIDIPTGVWGISRFGLDGIRNITSLNLPETITYLGTACFRGYAGHTIHIPSRLKRIPSRMLVNCTSLRHIYIPATVSEVRSWEHGDNYGESGAFAGGAPFYGTGITDIYCERPSKPNEYDDYWDYKTTTARATVHWGVSYDDYLTATGG